MYSFPLEGGKVPWSLFPKDKRFPLRGSVASAFHLAWRCSMLLDIVGTPYRNGGHLWRWWASRSRFAGSSPWSCASQNVLRTSMSDTSLRCLLVLPLVCIAGWSGCILGGIGVVLPKNSIWAHGRTYLFDDNSYARGSIQWQWISRCVHTRGPSLRWQGDAHQGMCRRCLFLPKHWDAISGLPASSRCPSCLLSPSRILEGAAPIISAVVWPLSWRVSTSRPHDQCR